MSKEIQIWTNEGGRGMNLFHDLIWHSIVIRNKLIRLQGGGDTFFSDDSFLYISYPSTFQNVLKHLLETLGSKHKFLNNHPKMVSNKD